MALMELAIQAAKEYLGNLDPLEILVNRAAQGHQEFVMSQCVIRPTTSGMIISARDPTSDEYDGEGGRYCLKHSNVSRK